jgi:hypothetical protein
MTRNDQLIIKLEFDNIIKYLSNRGDELTVGEVMQELGAIRMFIYSMGTTN